MARFELSWRDFETRRRLRLRGAEIACWLASGAIAGFITGATVVAARLGAIG